ncbi:hypothetical protein [Mangrovibacterium sp.]|uniref:hypothetical protein n=1 Tax=Mangrovibacterium sp. TaxID=1961364 RepID=UPI00356648A3
MRNLIILLMGLFLASCTGTRLVTETKTWVEYRDTVITLEPIPIRLPQSDINISMLLQVENKTVNLPKQTFSKGVIRFDIEVVNNQLVVNASLTDSTILVKPDPVRIKDAIIEKKEQAKIVIREKYIPWPYRWSFRIVLLAIVFGLLYLGRKFSWGSALTKLFPP